MPKDLFDDLTEKGAAAQLRVGYITYAPTYLYFSNFYFYQKYNKLKITQFPSKNINLLFMNIHIY